ncbi:unnamed protein product [Phyllotreta striolata]|uniref:Glucosylceramidase n=1 Tax=Phyllotreta striolata TaxID=444603 RepID=A0A9N9XQU8_PHYSR|nr:unnamed protein product [Phyllotreta striolata]
MIVLVAICSFLIVSQLSSAQDCLSRDFGNDGTVCVCNADHCDTLAPIAKVQKGTYASFTSNLDGLRFKKDEGSLEASTENATNLINIGKKTYQEILGFGGAFTDATGINIKSLSEDVQDKLIQAYFSENGLEYNIGRVPIGGTDFSLEGYSYCDTENDTADPQLTQFNLTSADHDYKIPFIIKALELTNNKLDLFGSAWIAPNWMKTIPGFLARDSFIKDEFYQAWADYFVKFLQAYKEQNIPFWGITTGNEPLTAYGQKKIPSVAWNVELAKKWIKENLGPALRKSEFSDIKLMMLDDQRLLLPSAANELLDDKEVDKYVDGIAVHWYSDWIISTKNLDDTNDNHPEKFLLATEACNGYMFNDVLIGNWDRGEAYAKSIIEDLNHWVTGWTDWNMALNVDGGPTFINNVVDSPIIVNAAANEFYKQPMYYALGHFSKFIPKGSLRLESSSFDDQVNVGAYRRPDGGTVVVVLNKDTEAKNATIRDASNSKDIEIALSPKSITSLVFW